MDARNNLKKTKQLNVKNKNKSEAIQIPLFMSKRVF